MSINNRACRSAIGDPKALRTAPRRVATAPAKVASTTHGHLPCTIDNLSRLGARALVRCRLRRGEHVILTLPEMAPLLTRVAWSLDGACGLEFVDPLHVAVLDRLLALYPREAEHDGRFKSLSSYG